MSRTRRLLRLLAVVAIVTGVLVPAGTALAFPAPPVFNTGICDSSWYQPGAPGTPQANFVLYGAGTPVVGGYMIVDLSGAAAGQTVLWDFTMPFGAKGAKITGSAFNDTICGTDGADWIWGKKGNDRIFGGDADTDYSPANFYPDFSAFEIGPNYGDHLYGNAGDDTIVNGWATITESAGAAALLKGGNGNDKLYSGDDYFDVTILSVTYRGGDYVYGNKGDDLIFGGWDDSPNYQHVFGNAGDDTLLSYGGGNNTISGGQGNDYFDVEGTADQVYGDAGDDFFEWMDESSDTRFYGGVGNDTMKGGWDGGCSGNNAFTAYGQGGDDIIEGCGGDDFLYGDGTTADFVTTGNDVIKGGGGADRIHGGNGNDTMWGGDGADYLTGGLGNDSMFGNTPNPFVPSQDLADGDPDAMDGQGGSDVHSGVCADLDVAADGGPEIIPSGDSDSSYQTWTNTGIELAVNACS